MTRVFGRSGRQSDPIVLVSIVTGLAAALASAILWIYRFAPDSRILGQYSADVAGEAGSPISSPLSRQSSG